MSALRRCPLGAALAAALATLAACEEVVSFRGKIVDSAGNPVQAARVWAESGGLREVVESDSTETLAHVLRELGTESAWVVHGLDGLDEITLTAKSKVSALRDGKIETFYVDPLELGLEPCEPQELLGGTAKENAATLREVLGGKKGPIRDVVLLNAAATLVVAGAARNLQEGLARAAKSVDSGRALEKLDGLVRMTKGGKAAKGKK